MKGLPFLRATSVEYVGVQHRGPARPTHALDDIGRGTTVLGTEKLVVGTVCCVERTVVDVRGRGGGLGTPLRRHHVAVLYERVDDVLQRSRRILVFGEE